jgi:phosphoribosyl 1,2-cyclic phosphodiesterase
MIAVPLQSGSSGNCIYVETNGVRLLFDAGICGSDAERRLASIGRNIRDVQALIISHDHSDHIRSAGVYQRKFGIPLYITPRTLDVAQRRHDLGRLSDVRLFLAGGVIHVEGVTVETVPTPHDGADGSVFVVSSLGKRLGIMTDLGYVFDGLAPIVETLDAVFLESNHDEVMLDSGPYPASLKRRIRGEGGHISNVESAGLLRAGQRLRWACLSHLSEKNNDPRLALRTHRSMNGPDLPLYVAQRNRCGGVLKV